MSNEKRNFVSMSNGKTWNPTQDSEGKKLQPSADSVIEGVYLSQENNTGKKGNSTIYKLMAHVVGNKNLDKPEPMSYWGTTVLNDLMENVNPGSYIQIKWLGTKAPKNGGKDFHVWDVAVDTNYKVAPVNNAPVANAVSSPAGEVDDLNELPF